MGWRVELRCQSGSGRKTCHRCQLGKHSDCWVFQLIKVKTYPRTHRGRLGFELQSDVRHDEVIITADVGQGIGPGFCVIDVVNLFSDLSIR